MLNPHGSGTGLRITKKPNITDGARVRICHGHAGFLGIRPDLLLCFNLEPHLYKPVFRPLQPGRVARAPQKMQFVD